MRHAHAVTINHAQRVAFILKGALSLGPPISQELGNTRTAETRLKLSTRVIQEGCSRVFLARCNNGLSNLDSIKCIVQSECPKVRKERERGTIFLSGA